MYYQSYAGISLARGFIVLVMPAVHTVMLYSTKEVQEGPIGKLLAFLAEGPGAQLFMFLMGVLVVLGRTKSPALILRRSLIMLSLGYLLNLLRLVLPYHIGFIPTDYLRHNGIVIDDCTEWNLLRVGDILQFASLGYLCCSLLTRLQPSHFAICILTVFIILVSPYSWEWQFLHRLPSISRDLLIGLPPKTFFPVFPWIAYPLLGLIAGRILKEHPLPQVVYLFIFSGLLLLLTGQVIELYEPDSWRLNFYRPGRGGIIRHYGIVLIWIASFMWIDRKPCTGHFYHLLTYLSDHITFIYIAQWIIIMWLFHFFGYQRLNTGQTLIAILATSTLSFTLPILFNLFRFKKKI